MSYQPHKFIPDHSGVLLPRNRVLNAPYWGVNAQKKYDGIFGRQVTAIRKGGLTVTGDDRVIPRQDLYVSGKMKVDEHFHYTREGRVLRDSMAVADNKRCCMSEDQDQMGMTSCNSQNQQLYEEYLQKMTAFYRKHPHAEVDKLMTVFFFNEVGGVGQKRERPKDIKDSEKPASSIFWSRL